ncbi:hypothetical protein DPEC_G00243280 [Dallia pectoralis]|uniref:Uncharacterized protein n=1 Tax=Dallia pectoralis TaxID=75939 RepID=A0ACC2FVP8_DALPE|nr:hypothetical protein DPEC_G00243280 [Dallia pectoralis]
MHQFLGRLVKVGSARSVVEDVSWPVGSTEMDSEVEGILGQNQERPPSSYGSMRSDEEEEEEEDIIITRAPNLPDKPEQRSVHSTGIQLQRGAYTETVFTENTGLPHPTDGAFIALSRPKEEEEEDEEEELDENVRINSPVPPPPIEPEDESNEAMDDQQQPGRLHSVLDLPFIFKAMQNALTGLGQEFYLFKSYLCGRHKSIFNMADLAESDTLDVVDKMLERFGKLNGLHVAIRLLESMKKPQLAEELKTKCKRAVIQYELKCCLIRRHNCIYEGVPRPGQQLYLKYVYVQPQISTQGNGGVCPRHSIRHSPPDPPVEAPRDSMVHGNDIFRSADGNPIRRVLTTGVPGIGNSVAVQKFLLDWAEERANLDLQFVFPFPFRELQSLRERTVKENTAISMLEMLHSYHSETRTMDFLGEADCKMLFIMDGIDIYKGNLDFKNTPVVSDVKTPLPLDSLLVNLIRGSLLPNTLLWLTGRRAATTLIPPEYIDRVYEIQGYSDEQKDEYLTIRHSDKSMAEKIIQHTKKSPTIYDLCHIPFCCWMVAVMYERGFRGDDDYGKEPPKITSFFIHYMIIQNNRKLEKYHGQNANTLKWTDMDEKFMRTLGSLALKLLEKNCANFYEDDLREFDLSVREVVSWSGLCTELPQSNPEDRRVFCFTHLSILEFIAAHYVWLTFRLDGRNVLDQSHGITKLFKERALVDMYRKAVDRYLSAPVGQYDLFLRFLCGFSMKRNDGLLRGLLVPHNALPLEGLDEVIKLLTKKMEGVGQEKAANLKECLRELENSDD